MVSGVTFTKTPMKIFRRSLAMVLCTTELTPLILLPLQKRLFCLGGFEGLISLPLFQEILWNQRDLSSWFFLRHLPNAAATTHVQFHPVVKREASLCLLYHRDVYSSSRRGGGMGGRAVLAVVNP